jgi:hypothetical protein
MVKFKSHQDGCKEIQEKTSKEESIMGYGKKGMGKKKGGKKK